MMIFDTENKRIIDNLKNTSMPTQNADLMLHYLNKCYDDNFGLIHKNLFSNNYFVSSLIKIISNNLSYEDRKSITDEKGHTHIIIDTKYTHSAYGRFQQLASNLSDINGDSEIDLKILINLCFKISNSSGYKYVGIYFSYFDNKFSEFLEDEYFINRYVEEGIECKNNPINEKNYNQLIHDRYRTNNLYKKLEQKKEAPEKKKKKI